MQSILLQLLLFTFAQTGAPIVRTGDIARSLTAEDFQSEELIELVTFIRSNPEVPEGRGRGKVGTSPISLIQRLRDASVRVEWRFEPNRGQTAILEKRGASWALISVNGFVIVN